MSEKERIIKLLNAALIAASEGDMPNEMKKWIDPKWIIPYDELREFKLPSTSTGSGGGGREVANFYQDHRGYDIGNDTLEELAKDGNLYYGESKRMRRLSDYYTVIVDGSYGGTYAKYYLDAIRSINPKAVLICVPPTRIKKFERIFGTTAKEIKQAVKEEYEDRIKKAGSRVLARMVLSQQQGFTLIKYLQLYKSKGKIADPELRKLGVLFNDEQLSQKAGELKRVLDAFANLYPEYPKHPEAVKKFREVYNKYPLFEALSTTHAKHMDEVLLYVNAAYAAREE